MLRYSNSKVKSGDLLLEFDDYSKPQLRDVLFEQLHLSNEKYDEDVCDYLISCLDSNGLFQIFQG